MTYEETLSYLYNWLPMYHRIGAAAYKSNLDNTHMIMEILDHPEQDFRAIHIAGTNGKGSVSNMIASVLQEAGYKTGLYTSPHLLDFRERVRINGKKIKKAEVVDFVAKYKSRFENLNPSFFEWTVGLAFNYFSEQRVDIAVIETGLGGRLDSTNVINPLVSVITNVSLDHTHLLGTNIESIATEKAGIIKPDTPVVIGEHDTITDKIFSERSTALNSPLYFAQDHYRAIADPYNIGRTMKTDVFYHDEIFIRDLMVDLTGDYQLKNICTALMALQVLNDKSIHTDRKQIRRGLNSVRKNLTFAGRWQIINTFPTIVCDTGHNEAGIKEVVLQIEKTPHDKLHMVIGLSSDKDPSSIIKLLPRKGKYYFTKASVPRAMDPAELAAAAATQGLKGEVFNTIEQAIETAYTAAGKNDLVFVGGSIFMVADALAFFTNKGMIKSR